MQSKPDQLPGSVATSERCIIKNAEQHIVELHIGLSRESSMTGIRFIDRFVNYFFSGQSYDDLHDVYIQDGRQNKSIRLYIMCGSLKSLHQLRALLDSGVLKTCIENWFNEYLSQSNVHLINIKHLTFVDYCKCEDYLSHGMN